VTSNSFEIEWPPRSGRKQSFAEVDRAAWFSVSEAQVRLLKGQLPFLERLVQVLRSQGRLDVP
jgi:predicted NUDIX family NTP pyrophosphohydrolase